jgi:hypothetical protein
VSSLGASPCGWSKPGPLILGMLVAATTWRLHDSRMLVKGIELRLYFPSMRLAVAALGQCSCWSKSGSGKV